MPHACGWLQTYTVPSSQRHARCLCQAAAPRTVPACDLLAVRLPVIPAAPPLPQAIHDLNGREWEGRRLLVEKARNPI